MLLTLLLTAAVAATPAPRFDAIQMMKLERLGDPQLSPDGKWVAYEATDVALDAGTRNTDIWIVSAGGSSEAAPRRLTSLATEAGGVLWIDAARLLVRSDAYPVRTAGTWSTGSPGTPTAIARS